MRAKMRCSPGGSCSIVQGKTRCEPLAATSIVPCTPALSTVVATWAYSQRNGTQTHTEVHLLRRRLRSSLSPLIPCPRRSSLAVSWAYFQAVPSSSSAWFRLFMLQTPRRLSRTQHHTIAHRQWDFTSSPLRLPLEVGLRCRIGSTLASSSMENEIRKPPPLQISGCTN